MDRTYSGFTNAQLLTALWQGGVGAWRWKIGSQTLQWTDSLERIHRLPEGSFDGKFDNFRRDLHPDDADQVWRAIEHTISTGEAYRVIYRSAVKDNLPEQWIEACGGVVSEYDGSRYLTGICRDVTQEVQGRAELAKRMRQQQGIARLSSYALEEKDFRKISRRAVEVAADLFDVPLVKLLRLSDTADSLILLEGVGWNEGLVGIARLGVESGSQGGYTLQTGGPVIVNDLLTEERFSAPTLLLDHGVRSGMSVIIAGDGARPFGVLGVHARDLREFKAHDIECLLSIANIVASSARQQDALDQQRLLMREMAHRSGNLLQVVNSLASQTFRSHTNAQVALRSFSDRLSALSRANYLLARGGWAPTRFVLLLDEVLSAFKDRMTFAGPDILLPADLSFDLSLVIHELATNSSKYGSLGTEDGNVTFRWRILKGEAALPVLRLEWQDPRPGPEPIKGGGFGSKLKRALIEQKWGGTITTESTDCYRFSFEIPLKE